MIRGILNYIYNFHATFLLSLKLTLWLNLSWFEIPFIIRSGMGHLELPNGATYDGQFLKGLPNGVGVMRFTDSSRYEGKPTESLTVNKDEKQNISSRIC